MGKDLDFESILSVFTSYRQQASHLSEVAKLKARVADLENLSQKIQLSVSNYIASNGSLSFSR